MLLKSFFTAEARSFAQRNAEEELTGMKGIDRDKR
jgi:hypothetical protein